VKKGIYVRPEAELKLFVQSDVIMASTLKDLGLNDWGCQDDFSD